MAQILFSQQFAAKEIAKPGRIIAAGRGSKTDLISPNQYAYG